MTRQYMCYTYVHSHLVLAPSTYISISLITLYLVQYDIGNGPSPASNIIIDIIMTRARRWAWWVGLGWEAADAGGNKVRAEVVCITFPKVIRCLYSHVKEVGKTEVYSLDSIRGDALIIPLLIATFLSIPACIDSESFQVEEWKLAQITSPGRGRTEISVMSWFLGYLKHEQLSHNIYGLTLLP